MLNKTGEYAATTADMTGPPGSLMMTPASAFDNQY